MNTRSQTCPLCGSTILRHVRSGGVYWFCASCHEEVPSLLSLVQPRRDTLSVKSRPLSAVIS